MTSQKTIHCTRCGSPVPMKWDEALCFDTEVILCDECKPTVRKPKVTMHGQPDGQEMARWTK